jgi:hypothetical protein
MSTMGYAMQAAAEKYLGLLGNKQVHEALLAGRTVGDMVTAYEPGLREFLKRRPKYLLYPYPQRAESR